MSTIKTPFSIASSGRVDRVMDQNSMARQQIIDVLVTSKFERTMRPGYGAGANDLMYEPVDELVIGEFKTDALAELNKRINLASVLDVRVTPASTPYFADDISSTIEISVYYRTASPGVQSFSFNIAAPGTFTEESEL